MSVRTEPRWKFVHRVQLPVFEDPGGPGEEQVFCPPSRVLDVSVVAERVFLTFSKYTEDSKTTKTEEIVSESVSAEALLLALVHQMGVEYVQGLLRQVPDA